MGVSGAWCTLVLGACSSSIFILPPQNCLPTTPQLVFQFEQWPAGIRIANAGQVSSWHIKYTFKSFHPSGSSYLGTQLILVKYIIALLAII